MPRGQNGRRYEAKATPQHNGSTAREIPFPPERRNKVPDIKAKALRWYVCTTIPQGEIRAAERLRAIEPPWEGDHRARAYVPCEFFWRRPLRANLRMPRREYQRPRLRSYVFVGLIGGMTNGWLDRLRERDDEGRNAHGLSGILGDARGMPLRLNDAGIGWLDGMASEERAGADATGRDFLVNDTLRVTAGPFAMFTGRMVSLDAEAGQIIVELSMFGRASDIRVGIEDVEHAA